MAEPTPQDARSWVLAALDRYERPLVRYAARLLGDRDTARDVVQHAFLRLCDQRPEDLAGRVGPWLFTVCRNRAIDVVRQRSRAASLDESGPQPCCGEPGPSEAAERDELYRRLGDVLTGLPPARREVLDLWSAGFSYREIAQIAGYTEGNVRVLVHRGLAQLRKLMNDEPLEHASGVTAAARGAPRGQGNVP